MTRPIKGWHPRTQRELFWTKVLGNVSTGCLEWQGAKSGGYGDFSIKRNTRKAHRVAYELEVGKIPEGLVIDHLCRNRACVRVDHLEPVTQSINKLRSYHCRGCSCES